MRHHLAIGLLAALAWVSFADPTQAQVDDAYFRALQALRRSVVDPEANSPRTGTNAPGPATTLDALERQYLEGKLTARQYHRSALEFRARNAASLAGVAAAATAPAAPAPATAAPTTAAAPAHPTADAAAGTNRADNAPSLDRLAAMEAEMDRIIQEKAARDKASTNQGPAAPAAPKSKRDKLNELLRELIAGKISEDQYKVRWAQITAEKE